MREVCGVSPATVGLSDLQRDAAVILIQRADALRITVDLAGPRLRPPEQRRAQNLTMPMGRARMPPVAATPPGVTGPGRGPAGTETFLRGVRLEIQAASRNRGVAQLASGPWGTAETGPNGAIFDVLMLAEGKATIAFEAEGFEPVSMEVEVKRPAPAFARDSPVVLVLIHGKTDRPVAVPAERINTLSHPLFYWGFDLIWHLLGGMTVFDADHRPQPRTLYSFYGAALPASDWTPDLLFVESDHRAQLVSMECVSADGRIPALSVMLTHRDGSMSLPDQSRATIEQIYSVYQAQFGRSDVKPELVLLGHSMGGLVSRQILWNPTGPIGGASFDQELGRKADFIRDRTRYLITLASPHEGSPIPETSVQLNDRIIGVVHGIVSGCEATLGRVSDRCAALNTIKPAITLALNAELPAMRHLTPDFWNGLNTRELAPHRAARTDGSLVPIYALGGRTPDGELGLDHDLYERRKATPAGVWDHVISETCLVPELVPDFPNCRQRHEGMMLMFIDFIVNNHVANLPPRAYGLADGDNRLDQVRRSFKRASSVYPMADPGETPERLPLLYFRGWQDGAIDNDGFVGIDSALGLHLGTGTKEYFSHGECWDVPGREAVRGSWYRLFDARYARSSDATMREGSSQMSFPWDWTNHGNIHHRAAVGGWLHTHIVMNAGPWVGEPVFSTWRTESVGC